MEEDKRKLALGLAWVEAKLEQVPEDGGWFGKRRASAHKSFLIRIQSEMKTQYRLRAGSAKNYMHVHYKKLDLMYWNWIVPAAKRAKWKELDILREALGVEA